MNSRRLALLTVVFGMVGTSCNGDLNQQVFPHPKAQVDSGPSAPASQPSSPPGNRPACKVLISEEAFSRFVAEKNGLVEKFFVDPGPVETCAGTNKSVLKGYNSLVVYPPLQVTGEARFSNGEIEVPIGSERMNEEFRKSLAAEFGLSGKESETLRIDEVDQLRYPLEGHAIAESLPRVKLRRKQVGQDTVLVLSRKKRIKEKKAAAFLERFSQGKSGIRGYFQTGSMADLEPGSFLLHAREHHGKNKYKRTSKLDVLVDFWSKAVLAEPETPEPVEKGGETADQDRDDVLRIAIQWRYHLSRVSKERVHEALLPMIEYASRRWIPRSPEPQAETAAGDLTALEFLGAVGGDLGLSAPIDEYYKQFVRLQPYFGYENSGHSFALLKEILQIVDNGSLNEAQQNAVHSVASLMNYGGNGDPSVWEKAKEVCANLAFKATKIARFTRFMSSVIAERWMSEGPAIATQILQFMQRRSHLSDAQVSLLSEALSWLSHQEPSALSTPSAVIAHVECLVFSRDVNSEKLNKLRQALEVHLSLGFTPEQSLGHAETELLGQSCPVPIH